MGLVSSEPGDLVWEVVGLKTMPVSTDWVSAVSPKLRGGLYIEAVSPGSPAAQAAIQKGDILVGMNVGTRHWETIRPDNILYVLRQPEAIQTQGARPLPVRRNGIQPRRISLAETRVEEDPQPVSCGPDGRPDGGRRRGGGDPARRKARRIEDPSRVTLA